MTQRNNSSTRYSFGESGAKNIAGNYKIFPVVVLVHVIIIDVMKVCHAPLNSRAERKRRLCAVVISHMSLRDIADA